MDKPAFEMLIGLPASGKSTVAKNLQAQYRNCDIHSSDAIRKELYGSESCQDNPSKVFELMLKRSKESLSKGRNVIFDATNISRKKRRHILSQLKECTKIAHVVWAQYEQCVERDGNRNRKVGSSVIKRMLQAFQPPYYDEGFDKLVLTTTTNLYPRDMFKYWMDCDHDNPHHLGSIETHTNQVVYQVCRCSFDDRERNILLNVARMHDVGKKFVKAFIDSRGNPCATAHFYDHHNVSSYFALGYCEMRNLYSLSETDYWFAIWLINSHMEPFFNSKYYRSLDGIMRQYLDDFHMCDVVGA